VRIDNFAQIDDSILFEGVWVREGARIKRTIIDKGSEIPPGMEIGYDLKEDAKKFTVTKSGIVVVPKGFRAQYNKRTFRLCKAKRSFYLCKNGLPCYMYVQQTELSGSVQQKRPSGSV